MLFAGKHIHGADSQFGRLCEPLKEPHYPKHGSQEGGVVHGRVTAEEALQFMEMLRTHYSGLDLPAVDPPDPET
ncbi:hypothetical protein WJX84_002486 [Apatococcus fuscideae]|uniref:Uncharacterized protein n=1 Tax=Apatococcus fuscideae TaxID=2026836 RepID=A0AAW1THX6_9CHLO